MKRANFGMTRIMAWLMVPVVALLTGCATAPMRLYTGPELPPDQVAKISVVQKKYNMLLEAPTDKAKIISVDGKTLQGNGIISEILVLPGQHEIIAQVHGQGPGAAGALLAGVLAASMEKTVKKWNTPLIFNAEAGKSYMIHFEFVKGPESPAKEEYFDRNKGKLWVYWIEEAQTGKYVCGWHPDNLKK